MKIKNILHATALRFSLIALVLLQTFTALAHTPTNPQPTGSTIKENLKIFNSLNISADNGNITGDKYYDDNTWYESSGDRSASVEDGVKWYDWKLAFRIGFKLDVGTYKITVNFRNGKIANGAALWIYDSDSYLTTYDSNKGKTIVGTSSYEDHTIEVTLGTSQVYWVSGKDGNTIRLHSIKVEKVETPTAPNLAAITTPYFWYYNGGGGFSDGSTYGTDGTDRHYRYMPDDHNVSASQDGGTYIYMNGDKIGGDNNTEGGQVHYGYYIFNKNEAVGVKLDNRYDYRIKVYVYDRDNKSATPDKNKVLYKGVNVETATRVDDNVSQYTVMAMDDGGPEDKGTRLITYEIDKNNATVYWIKNAIDDDLYIGGFEVLPKNYPTIGGRFTGDSWYVQENTASTKGGLANKTQDIPYVVNGNDVVIEGPAMPINGYTQQNKVDEKYYKTVMVNNGSRIGVSLPAGATIKFGYTADNEASGIELMGVSSYTNAYTFPTGTIEYKNETGAAQNIWITGKSTAYAYFYGFNVTQPVYEGPAFNAIDKDYLWYPINSTAPLGNETFSDNSKTVYIKNDFNRDPYHTENIHKGTITIHGESRSVYRTNKGPATLIGFKIAQRKKGVINWYIEKSDNYKVDLYQSNNSDDLGSVLTYNTDLIGNNVNAMQYSFDTTNGEKIFWFKASTSANLWFGGFEVLFEDANNGGKELTNNVAYTVSTTETITNALGTDTHPVFKSVNTNPVGGASMMMYKPGTYDAVAVGGNSNGIIVKVPADCKYLNVTGYLAGGATIKIYRGTASAPNTTKSVEISGSGDIDKSASLAALSGISGDVYWVTSDDVAGAYVTSVTSKDGTFTTLQPTDANYIYKVNGVPSSENSGVQNTGDCNGRIKFIDQNGSASTGGNPSVNVLGTTVTPVTIENGTDFFAVKVDEGPGGVKTGYVKVFFNGGNAGNHKMEELPLNDPMYSGWNSSYDPDTHIITFTDGGGRGWWFGNEGKGARDLSSYNKINIEIESVDYPGKEEDTEGSNAPALQVIIQSTGDEDHPGIAHYINIDSNGRLLGDIPARYEQEVTLSDGTTEVRVFDPASISQIYIGSNKAATVKIKSARLMNKPIVVAKGTDENSDEGYTELFGGKIYNIDGGYVYEYPFDLNKATTVPQLTWITGAGSGTINIAAIEVLYDSQHAKVVEWYVNKDTKMIVGSDDPKFEMDFNGQHLTYPTGYDEYVTFYMSSGRKANVSFIMPEAVREVYDWEKAMKEVKDYIVVTKDKDGKDTEYIDESATDKKIPNEKTKLADTYGKHTIVTKLVKKIANNNEAPTNVRFNGDSDDGVTITYDRDGGQSADMNKISGNLYSWYSYSYDLPSAVEDTKDSNNNELKYDNQNFYAEISVTATQKDDGKTTTQWIDSKEGQWKICMRFVAYKAPKATTDNTTVTVTAGQSGDIYYTLDSSDPENYGVLSVDEKNQSSTNKYENGVNVSNMNCIFKAAQYITTPYYFYVDCSEGKDSDPDNVLKLVSADVSVTNEDASVVRVRNNSQDDSELFNKQKGGYSLTIPTGAVINNSNKTGEYEQAYNPSPFMYLTLGGINHPFLDGNSFSLCGTNWKASDDSGLKTYIDSYKFKFDVEGEKNISPWDTSKNQNQNPYTECNRAVGGADTEDGGMFLQPISGTMLRFEPEYDGVITVWLRQNGCLDNNTQESGTFQRRPVYVMDENGRIMRRSTIRPTATHYMGVNGVWAINSSVCEERSQVEHTWLHEVAKQVFANHPLYAERFKDPFPNRWVESGHDHSGHILYGWWYRGFDLDANRSSINSASHVSRFEYMEPQLLYRSDKIYDMEMNRLGLNNGFAKYGFELPNFQYVRYRIPVKAGKTYYIAGRGTKNGFSAIRFDALKPNTSHEGLSDLRYTDNPEVEENPDQSSDDYLKISYNWDNNGTHMSSERSNYDLTGKTVTEVLNAYSNLTKVVIDENGTDNNSKINSHVYENGKVYGMDEYDLGNLVGKTVDVELKRTFKAYNWHPIILPFSLSETRVEQYFGVGTKVLYLDPYTHTLHNQMDEISGKSWTSVYSQALNGTKLSFTIHRYQMLYANTPAFICPTFVWPTNTKTDPATNNVKPSVSNGIVRDIIFKRVTLDGSNSVNDRGSGYFGYPISNDYEVVGCYDQTTHSGDIYYVNNTNPSGGKDGNTAQLVHSDGKNVTMKGTRVWIRTRAGATNYAPILTVDAKDFSEVDFDFGNEEAGINDIVVDDITVEGYSNDEGVYDLLGRKMGEGSLEGLPAGVYIFKGQKVYVK